MLELAARSVAFGHEGYTATRGDRARGRRTFGGGTSSARRGAGGCGTVGAARRERSAKRRRRRLPLPAGGDPRVYVAPSQ